MVAYDSLVAAPGLADQGFAAERLLDPHPLIVSRTWWARLAGPVASVLILAAVAYQLRSVDLHMLVRLLPSSPLFWFCFAAYYLAAPVAEWMIFRGLWRLPASGIVALLRKLVSNELLLGYSGEVYFYVWARRHARLVAAPFGALKDVTILSAMTGNAFCLLMAALAWPLLGSLHLALDPPELVGSAAVILLSSGAAMLFRRRLFTLGRDQLLRIAAIHACRIVAMAALMAMMWHLLLPTLALGWWLVLSAVRQLLSRLPLLPNKDVVFAGVAAVLVHDAVGITAAMTLMASLILVAHLCVGAILSAAQLAGDEPA